ncbi:MAG: porin [Pseudomonadota bacterium]
MFRFVVILSSASAALMPAQAETEFKLSTQAGLVLAAELEADGGADTEPALYELGLDARMDHYLENGVRVRLKTSFRVQDDHPSRPGYLGGFGADPAAPIGVFSGLSSQPARDQDGARGRFEDAYVQVDGGYGEARLGKGLGIAARFHEGAPSVTQYARLGSALLDPSGLNAIKTRHDLTGPSAKLSYATPRWLGVRAGLSYTPEANADGLDRRPAATLTGLRPDMENALEIAMNTVHRLDRFDAEVQTGLAWSTAEVSDRALLVYERTDTTSFGAQIARGDWHIGGSWLGSTNGSPDADYAAWSAGIGTAKYGLDWSLSYGESEDDGAGLTADGWRFGASKEVYPDIDVALVYAQDKLDAASNMSKNHAIVVEITLLHEFLNLSMN